MRRLPEGCKSALTYLGAAALSLATLTCALKLWRADLTVPLSYGGDALLVQLWVKGAVENGWYLANPSVGAPFGMTHHDFPMADGLFFLMLRVLSWAGWGHVVVLNVYYLLTFPLATVAAVFTFRRFNATRIPAVVGGLLFAFLPYHFYRGQEHLFLASYFLVPLAVWLILRSYLDEGPPFLWDVDRGRPALRLADGSTRTGLAICLLLGSGGVYYAFFICYFLGVSGAAAALRRRRAYPLYSAAAAIALISLGVLANVGSKFWYELANGPNPEAVARDPSQSELFGLKVIQLLLPVRGHRLAPLARLTARYETAMGPLVNENAWVTLGVLGGAGFLALTAVALLRWRSGGRPRPLDGLADLNLAAALLGTSGGFGTLFGFLVTPWIRGYNRIGIFIGFFSLFAVVLACTRVDRAARAPVPRFLFHGLLLALLGVGLLDQFPRSFVPRYTAVRAAYRADAEFVGRLESALPPGAMVFQLPYSRYPEPQMVHRMHWYEPLRGYLHSRSLRWSYGAMKGRYGDRWQARVADEPVGAMVRQLALVGFGGIWVDRTGYPDAGAALKAGLADSLRVEPILSADGRFAFYNLGRYADALRRDVSPAEWAAAREAALSPVLAGWGRGFYGPEVREGVPFQWSGGAGEVTLSSPWDRPRRVLVSMTVTTIDPGPSWVEVKGLGGKETFRVDGAGRVVRREVVVPPGGGRLKISGNGPRVVPPGDTRSLAFRVGGLKVEDAAGEGEAAVALDRATARR